MVVLEKMPETLAGGNSIASGQTFIVPSENGVPEFKKYLEACNEPNPIPDEYLDWLVNGFAEQLPGSRAWPTAPAMRPSGGRSVPFIRENRT